MLIKDVTIIATEIVDNEGIFRTVQKVNKSYGRSQNEGDNKTTISPSNSYWIQRARVWVKELKGTHLDV